MKNLTIEKLFYPVIAIAIIIIAILIFAMSNMSTSVKIDKKTDEKKTVQKQIDSLSAKRTEETKKIINTSQANAVQAKKLIKNLPNEKTIVRDTSYAAMCEFITNYRPN